jgi:hypothetical protein
VELRHLGAPLAASRRAREHHAARGRPAGALGHGVPEIGLPRQGGRDQGRLHALLRHESEAEALAIGRRHPGGGAAADGGAAPAHITSGRPITRAQLARCDRAELLALVAAQAAGALLPALLNVALGRAMHDAEAAFAEKALASAHGVGGGNWSARRARAWLAKECVILDTSFWGADYMDKKPDVAGASGFFDFTDMALTNTNVLRELLEDLDPEEWLLRFDVASPAFLAAWAAVLDRPMPTLIGSEVERVKRIGQEDYFARCPKLVLLLVHTSHTSDRASNRLRTVGALVLMRVDLKDGRSYLVERLYELPRGDGEATHTGLHRAAHCQGSHLPGNMLLSALYDLGEIGEDADAGCWADGVRELDARRARAAEALTRMRNGATYESVDARRLGTCDADILSCDCALAFHNWWAESELAYSLEPALRPGAHELAARLAAEDAEQHAHALAHLATPVRARLGLPPRADAAHTEAAEEEVLPARTRGALLALEMAPVREDPPPPPPAVRSPRVTRMRARAAL